MKTILLIALTLEPMFLFAQINSLKLENTQDRPSLSLDTVGLDVEGVAFDSSAYSGLIRNLYYTIGNSMNAKADERKVEIDDIFDREAKAIILSIQNETQIDKIKSLKRQLEDIENRNKSAMRDVFFLKDLATEYYYKARTYRRFKKFPVRNAVEAQVYYDQTISDKRAAFLNSFTLNFGGKGEKISLLNEIYSDYYGPTRFSFGVLVSNKSDSDAPEEETQEDAIQRFIGGGGNVILSLGLPILGYDSDREDISFKTTLLPKASLDVPQLGTEEDEYGFNLDAGGESTLLYNGFLDVLTIFANYRLGYVTGNTIFYENLVKADKNAFTLNQLSIGLAINSTFRLSWNTYWGGRFVQNNFPTTISFSVVPNK